MEKLIDNFEASWDVSLKSLFVSMICNVCPKWNADIICKSAMYRPDLNSDFLLKYLYRSGRFT